MIIEARASGSCAGMGIEPPGVALPVTFSAVLISCTTTPTPTTVAAPPQIPGATFVGNHACSECHDKIHEGFHGSPTAGFIGATRCNGHRCRV